MNPAQETTLNAALAAGLDIGDEGPFTSLAQICAALSAGEITLGELTEALVGVFGQPGNALAGLITACLAQLGIGTGL